MTQTSDLKQCLIDTRGNMSQNVNDEAVDQWKQAVTWMREGERTSLWTAAKTISAFFRATNSLSRKTCYVSRHFCHSYLKANKANKVSKSEWTRKTEYAYHFQKYADAVYSKLSKISPCLSQLQLDTVGAFYEIQCRYHTIIIIPS